MIDDTAETLTDDALPGWRARIVIDDAPEQPYDDGAAHVVSLDGGHYDAPAGADPDSVRRAWDYFRYDYDRTERYLRIWHGATHFEYVTTRDGSWIVYDSTERRAFWGSAEYASSNVKATADEWRAYVEGDVYGIVIERHRTGHTVWDDGTEDDPEEWTMINSIWGYYGAEYAEQAARELLTEHSEA
jgi:hypothetical protein